MELRDKFVTLDDDDIPDKSAVYYLTEQDRRDLIDTIEHAQKIPKVRFMKLFGRIEVLKRQLRADLK
jgi:hypothetical protein